MLFVDSTPSVVKAVAFDSAGNEVCSHEVPVELLRLHPDWVEQDMNNLWQTVKVCLGGRRVRQPVSCLHQAIPPFVEDLVQIIGGSVNCAPYVPAGQHKRIAEAVAGAIGEEYAVLLASHGVICCGRTLDEAFVACQILEKAAMMMLAAGSLGKVIPIPDESVRSERHRFLYKYGTAGDAPGVAS